MFFRRSRRRAEPTPAAAPSKLPSTSKSIYEPLPPNIESTRFLRIASASRDTDPVVCSLVQIPLAERPRFAALSYMWGPETPTETVRVNGRQFEVRKNLAGALRCLRRQMAGMSVGLFWIDALCINQADVEERSRQVRMMGQIYLRAQEVVVWLGAKYQTYVDKLARIPAGQPPLLGFRRDKRRQATAAASQHEKRMDLEQDMVKALMADGYWSRLWIIQEVSLNEMKRVCFGNQAMGWEDFVELVAKHSGSTAGPLRLDRHLKERQTGSRTLRRLLIDHQQAQCHDRRDKVYGLVGLAIDAQGFPMDYRKSPMEVWMDTMEFLNSRRLFSAGRETDVVDLGRLTMSLLLDSQLSPLQQLLRPYEPKADPRLIIETKPEDTGNRQVLPVKAYILGVINAIGPSAREVILSPAKAQQWAGTFQTAFRDDLSSAHKENTKLMNALQASGDGKLAGFCSSQGGLVRWRAYPFNSTTRKGPFSTFFPARYSEGDEALASKSRPGAPGDAYLYRLSAGPGGKLPRKMGIASGQALPGDLVCWVQGVKRAVVVRMYKGQDRPADNMLQVFGTALVTDDVAGTQEDTVERCRLGGYEQTTLKLDPRTIFTLLS
ncbi:HET domain-containing protein [Colletotrichum musicola]|uniref:HET domain-containing protein n=1 Tax=Colletotrichum musicola TaxID=2175873 RepID=A0A8H6K2W1_9PEZI|nr:HET domain-containing protein [Colletotrichum musicola]